MASRKPRLTVAEQRKYGILTVEQARAVASDWLKRMNLQHATDFGLPEVDDRYHIWRVPILKRSTELSVGECTIDARTSLIINERSTSQEILETRLLGRKRQRSEEAKHGDRPRPKLIVSALRNTIASGDSEKVLLDLPAESVHLVFTSPPYFNARPEYNDYISYEEYLLKMRKVIHNTHRVLSEGRFFVINVAPVLIRRTDRQNSSKRIAVPFDLHRIFIEEGFDFVDDIIWMKPEGAGWATGRGRRFAADRNPMQYKTVPITEYILVYRKRTEKLIDWHIRNHPNPQLVKRSRIRDGYERTNVWKIKPAHSRLHPAIFPLELASKVLTYYSFEDDVVLDPFAGIGTVGEAAVALGRRFVLIEQNEQYVEIMKRESLRWLGRNAREILLLNSAPVDTSHLLF